MDLTTLLQLIILLLCIISILLFLLVFIYWQRHQGLTLLRPNINKRKQHPKKDKYSQNGISKSVAREFKKKIIKVIEEEEHFLNPEFKLNDLCELVSLPRHQVSFILNQEMKTDFNSYINRLRINRAKHLIQSDPSRTVSEVTYLAGFNNYSTFSRAFKRVTNTTPRDYIAMDYQEVSALEKN